MEVNQSSTLFSVFEDTEKMGPKRKERKRTGKRERREGKRRREKKERAEGESEQKRGGRERERKRDLLVL